MYTVSPTDKGNNSDIYSYINKMEKNVDIK